MLEAAKETIPEFFPYLFSCYSSPSFLYFQQSILLSAEGVQQGDPLRPLLFCLVIHPLISQLKSEFRLFYLDDGTVRGAESVALQDLIFVEREAASLGLQHNHKKTELICEEQAGKEILQMAPELCKVSPRDSVLLGSPIGRSESIDATIANKVETLKVMRSRLSHISKHDALLLLRHLVAIPSGQHAPCFLSPCLETFDWELCSILSDVLNIELDNELVWLQATLPVNYGDLGIRRATQLAPSAFLASAAGCSDLVKQILPQGMQNILHPEVDHAAKVWSEGHDQPPPQSPDNTRQMYWDRACAEAVYDEPLKAAPDPRARARCLAVAMKESGAWLNALPVSSLGLRMDDAEVRIAIGLHLGAHICRPHLCHWCGAQVDEQATHGLSCMRSAGHQSRHTAFNDIIKRSLASAQIPSTLEPTGLCLQVRWQATWQSYHCTLENRPHTHVGCYLHGHLYSLKLVPEHQRTQGGCRISWTEKEGQVPVPCPDPSFRPHCNRDIRSVLLWSTWIFAECGRRIRALTQEARSRAYLIQQVSMALQLGNTTSVLGTTGQPIPHPVWLRPIFPS